jgi:hypothetical protein
VHSTPIRVGIRSLATLLASVIWGCAFVSPPDTRAPQDVGAAQVRSASIGALEAGAASVVVTPTAPAYMAGFKINKRHTEVNDPIRVRALALRRGGLTVALVSCDLIGLHNYQVEEIRRRLRGVIEPEALLVASTHNHAGPDTLGMWGIPPLWTGLEEPVVERVLAGVVSAVETAVLRLRPARARWGEGLAPPVGISRNRREPERIDRRIRVLALDAWDGEPIATLVHFACHPETLGSSNTIMSADFPGVLCDEVEAARPGSVALFFNGALGGMVTVDRRQRTRAEMHRIGATLAELSLGALESATSVSPEPALVVARRRVRVPVQPRVFHLGAAMGVFGPRPFDDGYTESEVWGLRLGEAVLVSAFGEVLPKLGFELDALNTGTPAILVGLGNDELGYLIHEEDVSDPRYDYELSVSPGPLASGVLRDAWEAILGDLGALRASE